MFLKGDKVKNGNGEDYEIVMHFQEGQFPLLAKNSKTGLLEKFTHEGKYHAHKESTLDLRNVCDRQQSGAG